jgi:hypothetical protein
VPAGRLDRAGVRLDAGDLAEAGGEVRMTSPSPAQPVSTRPADSSQCSHGLPSGHQTQARPERVS